MNYQLSVRELSRTEEPPNAIKPPRLVVRSKRPANILRNNTALVNIYEKKAKKPGELILARSQAHRTTKPVVTVFEFRRDAAARGHARLAAFQSLDLEDCERASPDSNARRTSPSTIRERSPICREARIHSLAADQLARVRATKAQSNSVEDAERHLPMRTACLRVLPARLFPTPLLSEDDRACRCSLRASHSKL